MNFLSKLDQLMKQHGLNKHTLAHESGIPYTTIVGLYERGAENARLSTVNRLCDYFSVPMDYLVMDKYERPEDFIPNERTRSVSCKGEDEIRLIFAYRTLNTGAKKSALAFIENLTNDPQFREEKSNTEMA